MSRKIEVIVLNAEDAKMAMQAGANRLELVTNMDVGGLSPNVSCVQSVLQAVDIPVNVMVRNQGDTFTYSLDDIQEMTNYINELNKLPINGIVFGALTKNGAIDFELLTKFKNLSTAKDFTFHRAIDVDKENYLANCQLLSGQVTNILSSGSLELPLSNNLDLLTQVDNFEFQLIVGGGINSENLPLIIDGLNNCDIHIGSLAYNQGDFTKGINTKQVEEIARLLNS